MVSGVLSLTSLENLLLLDSSGFRDMLLEVRSGERLPLQSAADVDTKRSLHPPERIRAFGPRRRRDHWFSDHVERVNVIEPRQITKKGSLLRGEDEDILREVQVQGVRFCHGRFVQRANLFGHNG